MEKCKTDQPTGRSMNKDAQIFQRISMNNEQDSSLVLALDDVSATLERVGGKGSSLARLAAAGFRCLLVFTLQRLPTACLLPDMGCKSKFSRLSRRPRPISLATL